MLIYPAQANLGAIQKMPRSYSDDLRCKILLAYEAGEGSLEELAEDFGVSYGYTKKIRQQQRRSGQMERTPQRYPSQSPLDENRRQKLQEWVQAQPDLTLVELQEKLLQEYGLRISLPPIWRALKKLGLRFKKKLYAQEQDQPRVQEARTAFQQEIGQIDPKQLVFLDETGLYLGMTRRYGRAPAGAVVREATPTAHWSTFTLLGALMLSGMVACMTVDAPTDTDIFLTFLRRVLCPKLRKGNVVVLDNLSVHHVAQVREIIEATGAKLLYLPPYSPDLNPIEPCWSKIKQKLRALKAQVVEALDKATSEAVAAVLPTDAKGFFGHCGYRIQ